MVSVSEISFHVFLVLIGTAENVNKGVDDPQWAHTISEAIEAERKERNMGMMQALRLYPKAVGWSLVMSLCIIMEGYDTSRQSSCLSHGRSP